MHPLKYSYDILGEEALQRLDSVSVHSNSLNAPKPQDGLKGGKVDGSVIHQSVEKDSVVKAKRDLYVLLRDNADNDAVLGKLYTEVQTVPHWVDWAQVARGQDVFFRYGGPAFTGLAYQSLLGGMGSGRVVEVLARTGGFSTRVARHRLFETTQFILQVTQSLHSIQPGGAGHASAVRVRLLHAAVRQRIMKMAHERPDYYDVDRFGVPMNDLDCVGTIATFSAFLLWLSFPRQGIFVSQQETADYMHLWRYVAYLMGTPTEYFETPEKSKRIMEVLVLYEINPSETSRALASNVINCLMDQPPAYPSKSFLEASSRWLNGNELCDQLGLGKPGMYYWALMAGQCLFFMVLCYTYRLIPYLDRRKIEALRRVAWAVVVESKAGLGEETIFEFKYIPDFSKITRKEDPEAVGSKRSGVEKRNLQTFVIACCLLSIVAYAGMRMLRYTYVWCFRAIT